MLALRRPALCKVVEDVCSWCARGSIEEEEEKRKEKRTEIGKWRFVLYESFFYGSRSEEGGLYKCQRAGCGWNRKKRWGEGVRRLRQERRGKKRETGAPCASYSSTNRTASHRGEGKGRDREA
jgi:hypothetical protein